MTDSLNVTPAELEAQADALLRQDRNAGGSTPADFSMLKREDEDRKAMRRYSLGRQNKACMDALVSEEYRQTPEEALMRKQSAAKYQALVHAAFINFERDVVAKMVLLTVLAGKAEFQSTQNISDLIGVSQELVHAAKERIRYYARAELRSRRAVRN